jgi:hypothetical protein
MAIPRFAEELWVSKPQPGVLLHGGILPGRPDWVYAADADADADAQAKSKAGD